MKKFLRTVLLMLTAALATTSCSKDDGDDNTGQTIKTDPALIGEWDVNGKWIGDDPSDGTGEAAIFRTNGEVEFAYEGSVYKGTHSVTDEHHFIANLTTPSKLEWVFYYEITGTQLYLNRGNLSWRLSRR